MGLCVFRYNLHFWQNNGGLLGALAATWELILIISSEVLDTESKMPRQGEAEKVLSQIRILTCAQPFQNLVYFAFGHAMSLPVFLLIF